MAKRDVKVNWRLVNHFAGDIYRREGLAFHDIDPELLASLDAVVAKLQQDAQAKALERLGASAKALRVKAIGR